MTRFTDPVPGGRPGEVERARALATKLTAAGVRGVVLSYVDTAGIARIKTIPVNRLANAAAWGVGMSPVFDTFLADDSIVTTDVLGGPDGDLRLYPDLEQVIRLSAEPAWAIVPVDRITQEGERHPGCTRTLLRHIQAAAAERGLTFRAAIEIEFALGRDDVPPDEFVPACSGPAYGMTRLVELSEYSSELLVALARQGVDVEQLHPEYAAGQFEISVSALDPIAAADRSLLVRQTIRGVAQRHGLRVSFAPSVVAGSVGNGGHVHLSVWRGEQNLHADGDGRYGLTPEGEAFVAGLLDALPALAAITTPSPSSYLRMQPSRWAGIFACWGRETREAAIRVITGTLGDRHRAANVEVKCADLAANPYLLLAGLLAAGLDGIDRALSLPEEISGDPARFDAAELAAKGVRRLPQSLDEAVQEFTGSKLLRDALGPVLADAVVAVRRGESSRMAGLDPAQIAQAYRWVY
jgi:glutamine synthetase